MEKKNKYCQSCSMPLTQDEKGGGSEANGSKSLKYCSYCYEGGKFKNPNMTLAEMKTLVKGKMKEMGFPGFIAGFLTLGISKLERWKNK